MIAVAEEKLRENDISLRFLGEILAIINGMPDNALKNCEKDLQDFTRAVRVKTIETGKERGSITTYAGHLRAIATSINERVPRLIDQNLVKFLNDTSNNYK